MNRYDHHTTTLSGAAAHARGLAREEYLDSDYSPGDDYERPVCTACGGEMQDEDMEEGRKRCSVCHGEMCRECGGWLFGETELRCNCGREHGGVAQEVER